VTKFPKIRCHCPLCKRIKRMNKICRSLPPQDAKWLTDFHNAVLDMELEFSMLKAAQ
jgi:hypothetical protein